MILTADRTCKHGYFVLCITRRWPDEDRSEAEQNRGTHRQHEGNPPAGPHGFQRRGRAAWLRRQDDSQIRDGKLILLMI